MKKYSKEWLEKHRDAVKQQYELSIVNTQRLAGALAILNQLVAKETQEE